MSVSDDHESVCSVCDGLGVLSEVASNQDDRDPEIACQNCNPDDNYFEVDNDVVHAGLGAIHPNHPDASDYGVRS